MGCTYSERISTLITEIIKERSGKNTVAMSQEIKEVFSKLRQFLYQNVYIGSSAKEQEDKAKHIVSELYKYYINDLEKLPMVYIERLKMGDSEKQVVCDYIAGMTDRYAIHAYMDLFFPKSWNIY